MTAAPTFPLHSIVALTVPHEHLSAGEIGTVLDTSSDMTASLVQFRDCASPELEDMTFVPNDRLRLAWTEANGWMSHEDCVAAYVQRLRKTLAPWLRQ